MRKRIILRNWVIRWRNGQVHPSIIIKLCGVIKAAIHVHREITKYVEWHCLEILYLEVVSSSVMVDGSCKYSKFIGKSILFDFISRCGYSISFILMDRINTIIRSNIATLVWINSFDVHHLILNNYSLQLNHIGRRMFSILKFTKIIMHRNSECIHTKHFLYIQNVQKSFAFF